MSAISIRLPDDLKEKAMRLAKKKNMSFNGLVNYWLQAAVMQEEIVCLYLPRCRSAVHSCIVVNRIVLQSVKVSSLKTIFHLPWRMALGWPNTCCVNKLSHHRLWLPTSFSFDIDVHFFIFLRHLNESGRIILKISQNLWREEIDSGQPQRGTSRPDRRVELVKNLWDYEDSKSR